MRPQLTFTAPPSAENADTVDGFHASAVPTAETLLPLDLNVKFSNNVLYTGSGNGLDADLLDGLDSSAFVQLSQIAPLQRKTVTKYAHLGGGSTSTTTATSGSPVDMPSTTISFSSGEITGTTQLVINYSSRITNSISGVHTTTYINVDGTDVAQTLIQNPTAGAWTQHATNAVVEVSSGSHTVKIRWSNWDGNGTATVADRDVTVIAIPE